MDEILNCRRYYVNEAPAKPYTIKSAGKEFKVYPFILSSENLDRQMEKVRLKTKSIANFKKNPQMYFNHDSRALPVGEWVNIRIEDGLLKADAKFHNIDEPSQLIEQYVATGQLKAASIGFQSLKRSEEVPDDKNLAEIVASNTWSGKITVHDEIDILEASIVGLPANPDALMGKSINLEPDVLKGINDLFLKPDPEVTVNFVPEEEKAGAVLNKKNKSKLENAKSLIDEVIASAVEEESEPEKAMTDLIESMQTQINDLKELVESQTKQIQELLEPEPEPEPKLIPIDEFLNRK